MSIISQLHVREGLTLTWGQVRDLPVMKRVSLRSAAAYRGTSLISKGPSVGPTVAICLGTYGDPWGVGVSYKRGTLEL